MVPELIPVLGSQPAGDVSHKPGGRLPLLSARPAVNCETLKRAATNFPARWTQSQWVWTVCLRLLPDNIATAIWTRALLHLLTTQLPSHPLPLCFSWSVQQIQRKDYWSMLTWSSPSHHPLALFLCTWISWPGRMVSCSGPVPSYADTTWTTSDRAQINSQHAILYFIKSGRVVS